MANGLMNAIRHALGFDTAPEPSTANEPEEVERRLRRIASRIEMRQKRLDMETQVLAADRRDARRK